MVKCSSILVLASSLLMLAGIASETMMASSFGALPDESQLLSLELVDENHFNQIFMWEGRSVTQSYIRQ